MKNKYKASLLHIAFSGVIMLSVVSCRSYNDVAAHYSNKHIKANTNQVTAQIPETGELGYVLLALSEVGNSDTSMIDKNSAYYQEVLAQFGGFKNHKAVKLINRDLKQNFSSFTHFRNGLYAYKLNERNKMVLKTDYRIDLNQIDFRVYLSAVEDFVKTSKFREFYKRHESFYNNIIKEESMRLTMQSIGAKMNKKYKEPFDSYQVIMSPLMKGYSSTVELDGRGFRECLIFAQTADKALIFGATKSPRTQTYND